MGKNQSLEGLRGVAALCVFLTHFVGPFLPFVISRQSPVPYPYPPKFEWERWFDNPIANLPLNGPLAVQIFFVLSGYVLVKRYIETGDAVLLRTAALKRYPRLMIPVAVSCLFAWVLWRTGAMSTRSAVDLGSAGWPMAAYVANSAPSFLELIARTMLITPFFPGEVAVNAPLWTISIEMLGALVLFAAFAVLGPRRPYLLAAVLFILAVRFAPGNKGSLYFIALFLGASLNYFSSELAKRAILSTSLFLTGLLIGGFIYSPFYSVLISVPLPSPPSPLFDLKASESLVYQTIGAFMIVAGVIGSRHVAQLFTGRICAFLGTISFSLYLIHWPIICSLSYRLMTFLVPRWGYAPSLALTFLVTLAVAVLASYAMARWVDQPSVRLADRFARWASFSGEHLRQPFADECLRGDLARITEMPAIEGRARSSRTVSQPGQE